MVSYFFACLRCWLVSLMRKNVDRLTFFVWILWVTWLKCKYVKWLSISVYQFYFVDVWFISHKNWMKLSFIFFCLEKVMNICTSQKNYFWSTDNNRVTGINYPAVGKNFSRVSASPPAYTTSWWNVIYTSICTEYTNRECETFPIVLFERSFLCNVQCTCNPIQYINLYLRINSKISTIENKNKHTWHVLCLCLIGLIVVQHRNDASIGIVRTPLDNADTIQVGSISIRRSND